MGCQGLYLYYKRPNEKLRYRALLGNFDIKIGKSCLNISLQASDLCFTIFSHYFIIFRLFIHLYNNLFILIFFLYSQFTYWKFNIDKMLLIRLRIVLSSIWL